MTIREAAQSALDVQNASNLSGVVKSLAGPVMDALWLESQRLNKGSKFVNQSPIVAMYLYKMGELNGRDISSLNSGYDAAEKACRAIASGLNYEAVVSLDRGYEYIESAFVS